MSEDSNSALSALSATAEPYIREKLEETSKHMIGLWGAPVHVLITVVPLSHEGGDNRGSVGCLIADSFGGEISGRLEIANALVHNKLTSVLAMIEKEVGNGSSH